MNGCDIFYAKHDGLSIETINMICPHLQETKIHVGKKFKP